MATPMYARYFPPVKAPPIEAKATKSAQSSETKKRKRSSEATTTTTTFSDRKQKRKKSERLLQELENGLVVGEEKAREGPPELGQDKTKKAVLKNSKGLKGVSSINLEKSTSKRDKIKKENRKGGGKDVNDKLEPTSQLSPEETNTFPEGKDETHEGADSKYAKVLKKFQKSARISKLVSAKEKTRAGSEELSDEKEATELRGLEPLPQPASVPDPTEKPSYFTLPPWLREPIRIQPLASKPFKDFHISPRVQANLSSKGLQSALPVQAGVLPLLLPGRDHLNGDLCISATTGSGKTLAYMLPMIESLREKTSTKLRGLIVVPTRELVTQARETCEMCAAGLGLHIGTAVGSRTFKTEQKLLMRKTQRYDPEAYETLERRFQDRFKNLDFEFEEDEGDLDDDIQPIQGYIVELVSSVDILIATPGRLVDHIKSTKGFTLQNIQWLVVDEADRLLSQSFQGWAEVVTEELLREKPYDELPWDEQVLLNMGLPRRERKIQKVILSATITTDLQKLSILKLRRPKLVILESERTTGDQDEVAEGQIPGEAFALPPTLRESGVPVGDGSEKPLFLLELLKTQIVVHETRVLQNSSVPGKSVESGDESSSSGSSETSSSESSESTSSSEAKAEADASESSSEVSEISEAPSTEATDRNVPAIHGVLIFTSSNASALRLSRLLSILHPPYGNQIAVLTSTQPTSRRRKTLSAFRNRKFSIIVASDLVSRGLDIVDLAHIINYDIPTSVRGYIHRVGRTARAGKLGHAWTLVADREAHWFWKNIASGGEVKRNRKVDRYKVSLPKEDRRGYEDALAELGKEVRA